MKLTTELIARQVTRRAQKERLEAYRKAEVAWLIRVLEERKKVV